MKRYHIEADGYAHEVELIIEEHPNGEFYKAEDVDSMLDKILLAVREMDHLARKPYGMVSREKP